MVMITKRHGKITSTQLYHEMKEKLPTLSTRTFSKTLSKELAVKSLIEAKEGRNKYIVYAEDGDFEENQEEIDNI